MQGSLRELALVGCAVGAACAVGAGLAVAVDHATNHTEIGTFGAGASVAVPVAIYLLGLWTLHGRPQVEGRAQSLQVLVVILLVLLTPATGQAVLLTGLLMAALLATKLVIRYRWDTPGRA